MRIKYGRQDITESDIAAVVDVLKSDLLTQGPVVPLFEKAVCDFTNSKYAVAVSSCTAGLHLSSIVAGLDSNNEFLTSPISFVSTANAGLYQNSKPNFIDIDKNTLNIDTKKILSKIKSNKKIKAIFPVHFAGHPIDIKKIRKFTDRPHLGLPLV